jgi:hypothetical protein
MQKYAMRANRREKKKDRQGKDHYPPDCLPGKGIEFKHLFPGRIHVPTPPGTSQYKNRINPALEQVYMIFLTAANRISLSH